jgi:hypothetical protein
VQQELEVGRRLAQQASEQMQVGGRLRALIEHVFVLF